MVRPLLALAALTLPAAALAAAAPQDRQFLQDTAQGARYEAALAQLAAARASKPAVRAYGQRVARDHAQANPVLMSLLRQEGVQPPAGMKAEDSRRLAHLRTLRGSAFDTAYVEEVTRVNAEDQRQSAEEAARTKDVRIRAYLKRFESMDAEHRRLGEALKG